MNNLNGAKVRNLVIAALLGASMLLYVRRILVPYQRADAAIRDHPRGNLSDLYPRWLGARELLLHGRDPYSPAVTREIQLGYYGRALDSSRQADPKDQQAFAYPAYVVFLLAPLIYAPFGTLRTPFYAVLIGLNAASLMIWLRALRWKLAPASVLSVTLLTLGSLPVIMGIELQQLTLAVTALLMLYAFLMSRGNLASAGILLSIASIKPQLVLPLAAWLTAWAFCKWRQRKYFLVAFLLTTGILCGAAEWALPGWIPEFIRAVAEYRQYTSATSLFENLTTPALGLVFSGLVVVAATVVCWRLRREPETSSHFAFAFALVLAVTVVIIPSVSIYNQVLLFPGILLLIQHRSELWNRNRVTRFTWMLSGAIFAWPWIAALGLTIASFIVAPASVQEAWMLPFSTSLATPLVVLGLLLQYAFCIVVPRSSAGVAAVI